MCLCCKAWHPSVLFVTTTFVVGSVKQRGKTECGISTLSDNQNLTGDTPEQRFLKTTPFGTGVWRLAEVLSHLNYFTVSRNSQLFWCNPTKSFSEQRVNERTWPFFEREVHNRTYEYKYEKACSLSLWLCVTNSHPCRRRNSLQSERELCFCNLFNYLALQWLRRAPDCILLLLLLHAQVQAQIKTNFTSLVEFAPCLPTSLDFTLLGSSSSRVYTSSLFTISCEPSSNST